jgi:signal transduction histidine kinase
MLNTEPILGANEVIGSLVNVNNSAPLSAEAAAGIVHDLGNLIQIASSAVNIIARRLPSHTSDLDLILAGARTSLDRAGTLVKRTMRMARDRSAAVQHVDVATCISEVEMLVRATWDHIFQLHVRADSELPSVEGDPLSLQNALFNLLLNARDAMPNGGVIAILAKRISLGSGSPGVTLRP